MMKALSVIELANLYGMNRQSIYKRINKGDLSKNSDGKIDFSEAIRVFGEPSHKNNNVTTLQYTSVQKETEVDMLKQQVDILKKQLDLTHRIEFKGTLEQPKQENINKLNESTNSNIATDPRPQTESNYDELTTPQQDNKRIPIPNNVEPEPEKRGFWSRFFKPYG